MTQAFKQQPSKTRYQRYETKYGQHRAELKATPIYAEVLDAGYCILPNYWTPQQCAQARQRINELLDNGQSDDIRVWVDEHQADQRILGANHLSGELDLFSDPYIWRMITRLYGDEDLHGFSMAARLAAKQGNKGSGQGWHRDSCIEFQFKAILYLSDVNEQNGPFQYYRGSAKASEILRLEAEQGVSVDQSRLDNVTDKLAAAGLNAQLSELCATEGTLILADTRGIHRGKPIATGERYALTNYYWRRAIPDNIYQILNTAP